MLASQIPTKIPVIWGVNADAGTIHVVPIPSQEGVTPGAASFTTGFTLVNATDPAAGGIPPSVSDMNGVLNAACAWLNWQQAGGVFQKFDAAFSAGLATPGYPMGAVLASTTPGVYWLSAADSNTTNPDAGGSDWLNFFPQNITGNAGTATKLAAPQVLGVSGAVSGAAAFDGSGPVNIVTTFVSGVLQAACGFSASFTNPGFFTIFGFVLNWGPFSLGSGGGASQAVGFAKVFPTQCLGAAAFPDNSASQQIGTTGRGTTGMTVNKGVDDSNARTGSYWAWGN
jgi:hypothetical protein